MDAFTECLELYFNQAFIKQLLEWTVVQDGAFFAGQNHVIFSCFGKIYIEMVAVFADVFDEYALGAPIALAEWMNHVYLANQIGQLFRHHFFIIYIFQVIIGNNPIVNLFKFYFNELRQAKDRAL